MMKNYKFICTGKKDSNPDNSLLNKKKINNDKKNRIKELQEEELDEELEEVKENLN